MTEQWQIEFDFSHFQFLFLLFRRAILGNPDVMDASQPWYQLLYNDFWGTPLVDSGSHGSYRPLCVLSYKLNYIIGGFMPFGYHLVNVLLHCLATGLVVKLARHILPYGFGTLISGLLFASHPIHTEAVAGIVGRADLIACNFYILTLLSYIRHVQWREKCDLRHWLALCGTVLCASAAVLCKETAVSALVVCVIYDILKGFNTFSKDKVSSSGIINAALITTKDRATIIQTVFDWELLHSLCIVQFLSKKKEKFLNFEL
jgi:protein O-mannosyl-transferase